MKLHGTVKGIAVALNMLGLASGGLSVLMAALAAAAGKPEKALVVLGLFSRMGLFAVASNFVRLPGWARERARQMEALAEHAVKLLSASQSIRLSVLVARSCQTIDQS